MAANLQIQLIRQRDGMPDASDFEVAEVPVPCPAAGQMLVQTVHLPIDPYMRKAIVSVGSEKT